MTDAHTPEKGAAGTSDACEPQVGQKRRERFFSSELGDMMYGFGGDVDPEPKTVDIVEAATIEFVADVLQRSAEAATRPGKLRVQDVLYAVRKDAKHWGRAKELLLLKKEIEEAKRPALPPDASGPDALEPYADDMEAGAADPFAGAEERVDPAAEAEELLHSGDEYGEGFM